MASQKQIAANRRNALKSTGPRTPEGKARTSRNSLRHGLYATQLPITGESVKAYDEMAALLIRHFAPQDPNELVIVQNMIAARWKLTRVWSMENALLNEEIESQQASEAPGSLRCASARAGLAFTSLSRGDSGFRNIARCEAAAERSYQRWLNQLLRIRKTPEIAEQTEIETGQA